MRISEEFSATAELKQLWLRCFDDNRDYVDFFFKNGFDRCRCVSAKINGKTVGALYLFNCRVLPDYTQALYWYAGAVLPEYRNKGVYKSITEYALKLAAESGSITLCCCEPELKAFYNGLGITDEYYCDKYEFEADDNYGKPIDKERLSAAEYSQITTAPRAKGSVIWVGQTLEYVLSEIEYCSGSCDKLFIGGNAYYMLCDKTDGKLRVLETNIPPSVMTAECNGIMRAYNAESMTAYYPFTGKRDKKAKTMLCMGNGGFNNLDKWFSLNML